MYGISISSLCSGNISKGLRASKNLLDISKIPPDGRAIKILLERLHLFLEGKYKFVQAPWVNLH
uniref:Uncharacterized protein n=1 Tax=Meloidogyne incognita TaxID=6306 RepID=A0A914N2H5_MELIC